MKISMTQLTLVSSLLAGCGGGGGSETLSVDFGYGVGGALLWRNTSIPLIAYGLNGKTPNCSVVSGELPKGLTLAAQGCLVSGVPEQVGVWFPTIRLTVPGYSGQVDNEIRFEVSGPPLYYNALPLTERRGTPIAANPMSPDLGGIGPWSPEAGESVTYSVASGKLPAGLQLDSSTGEIHGILTTANIDQFVIAATASGVRGTTVAQSQQYSLNTVSEGLAFFYGPNDNPVGISLGDSLNLAPLFNFGFYLDSTQYSYGTYRVKSSSQPLPPGLTLDAASGQLSGVPLSAGSYEIQFEVELSSQGQSAFYPSSTLLLTVAPR